MVDGTQDVSRKEQTSMGLRYVDDEFVPHKEFIGMYEPPTTTGKTTGTCVKDVWHRFQLPLSVLHGQTYDGASNDQRGVTDYQ